MTLSLVLTGPAGALLAFAAVGSAALVGNAAVVPRRDATAHRMRGTRPARAGRRALRTLLGVRFAYTSCMGAMWVLVPAFATATGHPDQAGLLVTVWSAGSLAGGLVLARRGRLADPRRTYLAFLATLAVTSVALPLPRTVPQMAVALAVFGLALAPWLAVTDQLMARAAPAPHTAEAYGWLQTAGQLGLALNSGTSGAVSDRFGTTAAFLIVSVALAVALAVGFSRRRSLPAVPAPPAQPIQEPESDVSSQGPRVAR